MTHKRRFPDLVRYFIVFEDDTATSGGAGGHGDPVKKMAGYHQFHAVNMAVEQTIRASMEKGIAVRDKGGHYLTRLQRLSGSCADF